MIGNFFFFLLNILIATSLSLYIVIGYVELLMLKLLDTLLYLLQYYLKISYVVIYVYSEAVNTVIFVLVSADRFRSSNNKT